MDYKLSLKRPNEERTAIQFIAFIQKRRFKTGIGVSVSTADWDKDAQRIKTGSSAPLMKLQQKLQKEVDAILDIEMQIVASGEALTVESLRDGLNEKNDNEAIVIKKKGMSFDKWVDGFMVELAAGKRFGSSGKALSVGTAKRYKVVHELLKAFRREKRKGRTIEFAHVDVAFINDWKRWRADGATIGRKLIRPAVGVNTLANDMKILKVWLKQSYLDGMHDNRIWQRREMQKSFVTPERPRLSLDELKKLEVADFEHLRKGNQGPRSSAHNTVRDMFLLACWTAARISDVKRFPDLVQTMWDDEGGECPKLIEIIQGKTETFARMPIISPAKRIIDKYEGKLPKLPNGPKTNRILKEVIKAAGITRSFQKVSTSIDGGKPEMVKVYDAISFHDARRTCLTNFYLLNVMTTAELMLISGHSTEAQFFAYIKIDKQLMMDRAAPKLLEATAHL